MVWARTLAQIVSDVTDRCDVSGNTARHPLATVRARIIESYQALRDMMISEGSKRWIVGPRLLSATSGNWTHMGYAARCALMVQAGAGAATPYERPQLLEVYISGRWQLLDAVSVGELRDNYQQTGYRQPQAWALIGNADEATGTETATGGQFAVLVAPDFDPASYPIQFYAASVINVTDADATTLTLDGPGFEWIIWDTVIKIAARDNDSANTYQIAQIEREKAETRIKHGIRSELRTTVQRRDVFGGNQRLRRFARWP